MTGSETTALFVGLLLALGIAASPFDYLGGMGLALWLAYFIRLWRSSDKRKGIALSLLAGATVAHATAIAHPQLPGSVPVQLWMMIAGGLSQGTIELFVARGPDFVARMADLAGFKGDAR